MGHEFDQHPSTGGINVDAEVRSLPKTEYQYALNLRNGAGYEGLSGVSTNVKGNKLIETYLCPYTGNNGYPTGFNHSIGYFEDIQNNTVIYFVWNSNGDHGIYRHYPDKTDITNPYGVVEQVIQYNFGWKQDERITSVELLPSGSGDLVYWTDSQGLWKINADKGNVVNKLKCWNVFFPETIDGVIPATTTFTFKNFAGGTVYTKTVNTSNIVVLNTTIFFDGTHPIGRLVFQGRLNFSGLTEITISGSSIPANNKTYVILGSAYNSISDQTIIDILDGIDTTITENATAQWTMPDSEARNQIIKRVADEFNADANSPVNATACACHLEICEKVTGTIWTIVIDTDTIDISPANWYGANLQQFMFARAKAPSMYAPLLEYKADPNYLYNNVKNKVFQAALQFYFDDFETSVLSVASQLPINNLSCDGTDNDSLNYIDINFGNPDLITFLSEYLVMIKKVGVIVREGNTGIWKTVEIIEACDFLDYANGAFFLHYKFYNDTQATPVDTTTATQLDSGVPIYSDSEATMFNRIIDGGITQGRDAPECVIAKAQIEFSDDPNIALYNISGLLRIFNPFGDNNADLTPQTTQPNILERRMPILYDTTAFADGVTPYPFFGGVTVEGGATQIYAKRAAIGNRQLLPEGGFAIYAAGADYLTVSKQRNQSGLSQNGDGSINASDAITQNQVKDFYLSTTDLYSDFSLKVPAGEYIIRVASHWCSFGDKLGRGFMYNLSAGRSYQQTSTYIWGVNDYLGGGWKPDYEIKVTVTNADVFIGEFVVLDCCMNPTGQPFGLDYSVSGYVFDNFGKVDVPSLAKGVTVEKAYVKTILDDPAIQYLSTTFPTYLNRYTDHNGFFYTVYTITGGSYNLRPTNRVQVYQVPGGLIHNGGIEYFDTLTQAALELLYLENIGTNPILSDGTEPLHHWEFICPVDVTTARDNSSTFIEGRIVNSNGSPVQGITILYQHGRTATSQSDGSYSLLAWGDLTTGLTNNNRIIDNLFFNALIACLPIYPNGKEFSPVLIDPFGTASTASYNPNQPYLIPDFIVDENNNPSFKALKRGGNYVPVAGRGYDPYGRYCSVFPLFQLYLPFITEDIGLYNIEDFSGGIYPSGTFKYGKPSVKWVLDPSTVFPLWMDTFQILLPKNGIYGRYLQWVANQVTYVAALATLDTPEIKTTFQNRDATAVKISIKNIVDYSAQNNNSLVGYQYQAGDRVRLITDRSLNYINGLHDFEVTSYDVTTFEIIIKPQGYPNELQSGMLFEVFNPKTLETRDAEVFYEVGEVVKVVNGIPAKYSGILTAGDTYWRGRLIIVNDNATKFAAAYNVTIEDASVSDFYLSNSDDINPTRIGIIDPNLKQIYYRDRLIVSDPFQEGSALNGLSFCLPTNTTDLGAQFGNIARLIVIGKLLYSVMKNTNMTNTVGVVSLQYAQATDTVEAISSEFLGTQYSSRQNIGTDHPASVSSIDGYIYGLFEIRKNVWRHSQDGSIEISRNDYNDGEQIRTRMMTYFKKLCEGGLWDATSILDKRYKEYILTVWKIKSNMGEFAAKNSNTTIYIRVTDATTYTVGEPVRITFIDIVTHKKITVDGAITLINGAILTITGVFTGIKISLNDGVKIESRGEGTTIAWNEVSNSWKTTYSFVPECFASLGDVIYSFKNAQMWVHDVNEVRNSFYGEQFTTQLKIVFNEKPSLMKVWNAAQLETKQSDGLNYWAGISVTNDNGQSSKLPKGIWRKIHEDWYAPMMKDELDLTKPPLARLSQGKPLISSTLTVLLENDSKVEMKLRHWIANFSLNQRTGN